MKKPTNQYLLKKIRIALTVFIILLVLSGITAFPLESELGFLNALLMHKTGELTSWINLTYTAVAETNSKYPFLSYGTDWLAFAHLVIAVVFIGPIIDPIKNIWVIQFGIISCLMVIPLALIAGSIRGIPVFWQFIDCSFGVIGIIPLYLSYNAVRKIIQNNSKL